VEERGKDYLIVMGDWNAIVGEEREGKEIGSFGLGNRNERGQQMVDFCKRMSMVVTNTWFNQHKRRRYTWKRPGDTGRYQLDYILVRQRYRNSVKNARSYPGADIDSDHNLVMMKVVVSLKK
jgi:endonuclease/exonuclease/phosphatase family metal-dependent hydrolase